MCGDSFTMLQNVLSYYFMEVTWLCGSLKGLEGVVTPRGAKYTQWSSARQTCLVVFLTQSALQRFCELVWVNRFFFSFWYIHRCVSCRSWDRPTMLRYTYISFKWTKYVTRQFQWINYIFQKLNFVYKYFKIDYIRFISKN